MGSNFGLLAEANLANIELIGIGRVEGPALLLRNVRVGDVASSAAVISASWLATLFGHMTDLLGNLFSIRLVVALCMFFTLRGVVYPVRLVRVSVINTLVLESVFDAAI